LNLVAFSPANRYPSRLASALSPDAGKRFTSGRMSHIEIRDVSLVYDTPSGRVPAVDTVSFDIATSEFVCIVGPSGCGKSTLLKLIAGLLTTTRGSVAVDGRTVVGPLKNVGMAFQNPVLLPWRTVLDNLLLPLEILRENGDPRTPNRAAWRDRALALLRTVGLDGAERRQPRELSGGMRQRVSLCRALIHEPALLLLDEPFAALDPRRRTRVRRELHAMQRELGSGLTVLQVTHDFAEAGTLGDVAILIEGGRLVQAAPPQELFRRPATAAAAEFLGAENVYAGVSYPLEHGGEYSLDTLRFETGGMSHGDARG